MEECCYIIGSGPSLLSLSEEEKDRINNSSYSISLNDNILYRHKTGVIAKDILFVDYAPNLIELATKIIRASAEIEHSRYIYINRKYHSLFNYRLSTLSVNLAMRFNLIRKERRFVPFMFPGAKLKPIEVLNLLKHPETEFYWGRSLHEPLAHFRGSLITAINIAALIYPVNKIKLVGIDLNTFKGIYEPRKTTVKEYNEKEYHVESKKLDVHPTSIKRGDVPGVQDYIRKIRVYLEKEGKSLVCANPESLLVKENVCVFEPV